MHKFVTRFVFCSAVLFAPALIGCGEETPKPADTPAAAPGGDTPKADPGKPSDPGKAPGK